MGIPQIIFIVLTALGAGISLKEHGQPKKGVNSFWSHFISIIITYTLLIIGGFFN